MSRHWAPHKLAQLSDNSLGPASQKRAREHLASCQDCRAALERIEAAGIAMRDMRDQEDPDLGWEHIAARVYWSTSSERRQSERGATKTSLGWRLPVLTLAIAAGVALAWGGLSGNESSVDRVAVVPPIPVKAAPKVEQPVSLAPVAWSGLVTFVQGDVQSGGSPVDFDAPVVEGSQFTTGAGSVAVQFGDGSAFRIAANSELRVQRMDSERIELDVVGLIDVDITRRAPGQEFVVRAGDHRVLVRGTSFQVNLRDDELAVRCVRGKVVVTDGREQVEVVAGSAWNETALRSSPIPAKELAALDKAMQLPMLPVWSDSNAALSSVLNVEAKLGERIAVDGVFVSEGEFSVRVLGGRHQVSSVGLDDELGEGKWIEAQPGEHYDTRVAVPKRANKSEDRRLRKRELRERIEGSLAMRRCLTPLAKQGLMEGSYLSLEVGINEDGSQAYLNVLDSNLSPVIQRCLKRSVDAIALPAGPSASLKYRMEF